MLNFSEYAVNRLAVSFVEDTSLEVFLQVHRLQIFILELMLRTN